MAAITVFFGLSVPTNFPLNRTSTVVLLVAFASACVTISFVPIRHPPDTTHLDHVIARSVRRLWLSKLMTLNLTVVLTLIGLLDALQHVGFHGCATIACVAGQ